MFKIGDYVTRKKYNNDILFKIKDIKNGKYILIGVDLRLYADAYENDLQLTINSKKKLEINLIRKIDVNNYFYIPGVILHLDSDKDYLDKCLEYYKNQKLKVYGYVCKEINYSKKIKELINKHKPNIIVITGHDAYYKKENKYKNSLYFIECVKVINSINRNIIIVAGACQSDFKSLIASGASFASSPSRINIHALDPAIIASYIALSNNYETIDLNDILSKTKYGSDGIGGIKIKGVMLVGAPRKDII